ncbi:MAG: lysylphosphatidylglycerol synthase transmembrane domain-containing protein, partial [Acidimicrobiales bacterium]
TAGVGIGLAAVGIIQLATTLALPILVLPVLVADPPTEPRLTSIALSAAVFFLLLLAAALVVLNGDRLLLAIGYVVDRVRRLARMSDRSGSTADRLIDQRDGLRAEFEPNWLRAVVLAVGRSTFDFLSLLTAAAAFGLTPRPSLVLLAFASASLLAMIPITPGGLGFVEAGLTGMLVLAGLPAAESVSVAFLYRLFSFWLPIPVGMVAGAIHGIRYRDRVAETDATD